MSRFAASDSDNGSQGRKPTHQPSQLFPSSTLNPSHTSKSYKSIARDRFKHSHLGLAIPSSRHGPALTLRKKGGGGKYTAGKLMEEKGGEEDQLDPHDPNYDENEIATGLSSTSFQPSTAALQLFKDSFNEYQRFKSHLISEVDQYLSGSSGTDSLHAALQVAQSLKDLDLQDFHYDLVYILIKWDIENRTDGKKNEMERIVKLVKCLHDHNGCVLTPAQIDLGLRKLYNSLDDLLLEHPHAKTVLHQYVVAFESSGLTEYTWQDEMEELEKQAELLKDQETDKKLHDAINKMLESYVQTEDLDALATAIQTQFKNKPQLHFEIVKCSMIKALQSGSNKISELMNEMLAAFVGDLISFESASAGILHFLENCEEIEDEYTNVLSFLSCFVARCIADHVVGLDILSCPDMIQRKLASQIMAQAKHLLKGKGAAAKLQKVWQISDKGLVSPAMKTQRSASTGSSASPTIGSPLSLGGRRISSSGAASSHSKSSTNTPDLEKRRLSIGGGNPFEGFVIGAKKPGTAAFELDKMKKDSPTAKKGSLSGHEASAEEAALQAEKERLDSFGYYDPAKMRGQRNSVFANRARFM